jgi:hypothetical protein
MNDGQARRWGSLSVRAPTSREGTLQARKESELIAPDVSSNGSHADAREPGEARVSLSIPAGPTSVTQVRDALSELIAEGDRVVLEQVAVLVGALTSGTDRPGAEPSAPFDLELRAAPNRVVVELYDPDFTTHRSEGGLVELERSMLSPWRLKLVERLADRWSVTHDELFTMRFEFDSAQGMVLRTATDAD